MIKSIIDNKIFLNRLIVIVTSERLTKLLIIRSTESKITNPANVFGKAAGPISIEFGFTGNLLASNINHAATTIKKIPVAISPLINFIHWFTPFSKEQ